MSNYYDQYRDFQTKFEDVNISYKQFAETFSGCVEIVQSARREGRTIQEVERLLEQELREPQYSNLRRTEYRAIIEYTREWLLTVEGYG